MVSITDVISEINTVGKDWEDEKKCRIIYREVMQRARYNPVFSYLNDWEQLSVYNQGLYTDKLEEIFVTCKQVGIALVKYLKAVGINATLEGGDTQNADHVFVIAEIKNNNEKIKICLDTFKDLMYAKKGAKLRGYGISSNKVYAINYKGEVIPEIPEDMKKRAEQYDIERGYVYSVKTKNKNGEKITVPVYLDDVVEELKKEMSKDENIIEYVMEETKKERNQITKDDIQKYKVHFLTQHFRNTVGIEATQAEWHWYFEYISKRILGNSNIKIRQTRLGNINKSDNVDMLMTVEYSFGEKEYYLYDENEKGYVLKNKEMIKKFQKEKDIKSIEYTI